MSFKLRQLLVKVHLITLALAIINTIVKNSAGYSLDGRLELFLKLLVVVSGLTLFFYSLRPLRRVNLYFSVYAVGAFLVLCGLLVRGMFWSVVLSIVLFPIMPDSKEYEKDDILITTSFTGLMASCCTYQIKERQLLLFEKHLGNLAIEGEGPIDFETVTIHSSNTEIAVTYSTRHSRDAVQTKRFYK